MWVPCDVRGDGRFGCDVAETLPAVRVSLKPASRGAMQPCGMGLVDVQDHVCGGEIYIIPVYILFGLGGVSRLQRKMFVKMRATRSARLHGDS